MRSLHPLSQQPSLTRLNASQALSVSSQYDFEKGVLVNIPVEVPEPRKHQKLPRLMRHLQSQQIKKFFLLPQQSNQPSEVSRKHKRLIPFQLVKVQPPPLGYYNINDSGLLQKSVVDMSKQPTARQVRQHKSKSIDFDEIQPEQQPRLPRPKPKQIFQLPSDKLSQWITKELEQIKEAKKFESTTYKGAMSDEQQKTENFQRLFDATSKKIKNSYVKYYF